VECVSPAKLRAAGTGLLISELSAVATSPTSCAGAHSKKALEAFCVTCKKSICSGCAIDSARCKSHETRPLTWIVSLLRAERDAWVQVDEGRPQQLQSECARVDAAADTAIAAFTSRVREEAAELKLDLQRACEFTRAALRVLSESKRSCWLTWSSRPRRPRAAWRAARQRAVAGHIIISENCGHRVQEQRRHPCAHHRQQRAEIWQFAAGYSGVAFDSDGNLVVADSGNHRVQVVRYRDGAHVRTMGSLRHQHGRGAPRAGCCARTRPSRGPLGPGRQVLGCNSAAP
jgi:hypothetical protein